MPSLAQQSSWAGPKVTPSPSEACGNWNWKPHRRHFHQRCRLGRRRKWALRKGLREIRGRRAQEAAGRGQSEWGPLLGVESGSPSVLLPAVCVGCISKGSLHHAGLRLASASLG